MPNTPSFSEPNSKLFTTDNNSKAYNDSDSSFTFIWQSAKVFWFEGTKEELWDRYFDLFRLFLLLIGSAICAYFFTLNMGILMEAYQVGLWEPLLSSAITLFSLMIANTWFEMTYMNYAKLLSFKWRWAIQNLLSKLFTDEDRINFGLQRQRGMGKTEDEEEHTKIDRGNSVINLGPDIVAGFFQ